jgi:hypothetical protein
LTSQPYGVVRRHICSAAIAFTALLTGAGIWLAMALADLRNTQDCVLMGRRDCAHISAQKADLIRHN